MSHMTFLAVLGVTADADARAIKRAYAASLKQIDQAVDPAAFARLREAYEQALAYVADKAANTAALAIPAKAPEEPAAVAADTLEPPPADDLAHTLRLAEGFAVAAQRAAPEQVRAMLDTSIAGLRRGYLDAGGRFEERVIDLLMAGAVGNRPAIFTALREAFHWDELGRLTALGTRGRWIEAVMTQEDAWLRVMLKRRAPILNTLREAAAPLTEDLMRSWPRVRGALEEFPQYLSLHLHPARKAEWRERYEAFDAARTAAMPEIDAPRAHQPRRETTKRPVIGFGLAIFVLLQVGRILGDHHVAPPTSAPPAPIARVSQPYESPANRAPFMSSRYAPGCEWVLRRYGTTATFYSPPPGSDQESLLKTCREQWAKRR
jgi:hypothetical protein